MLTMDELRADVDAGLVDTVVMAITDMQGRLQGKRLDAGAFVREIAEHGAEGCHYLLAVDIDMNTLPGFEMSGWDSGYGDFVFRPDLATLRRCTWLEGTVMVQADMTWHDGSPVAQAPRSILKAQLARLEERGWSAKIGSELEFILFRETYEDSRAKGYRDLVPANAYNVDYSIFGTTIVEDVIRPIRKHMANAGLVVEDSKGECNFGQHEVNFRYADALKMADDHAIYKNAAKEIAWQRGVGAVVHREVQRARGQLVPHPLLVLGRRREPVPRPGRARPLAAVRVVHRRPARAHHRARVLLRAQRELVQALRPRIVRADRDGVGRGQPHVRVPRRRARQGDAARVAPPRRRLQPVPRVRRDHRDGDRGDRPPAAARAGLRRQRLRLGRRAASRAACTRRCACWRAPSSPAARSATS